ncbi:MAG: YraN family protein [Gemmatimonadales bacterium]
MSRTAPGDPRQTLGRRGEQLAARFLERAGLRVIERRFRLRCGEIDLIALDREWVVFIEVKTRRGSGYGTPAESVTPFKQRKMARTALAFLAGRGWHERPCRFDVVEVVERGKIPEIRHIPDAFRLGLGAGPAS